MKISDLVGKYIAVHCDTKEKIDILIKSLEKRGYKYDDTYQNERQSKNVIETLSKYGITIYIDLTEGYIDCAFPKFYRKAKYKVIKFEELELED